MHARLLCDTGSACLCAGVRTAARARFARACACMRLRRISNRMRLGSAHKRRGSLLIHDLTILARLPRYAQCRHEGGGTSGGGSGDDAVRTIRAYTVRDATARATAVAAQWLFCCCGGCAVAQWCLYPRPSACAAAPRVRWRVPYLLAICSPFSRFIRHIRFIICASA